MTRKAIASFARRSLVPIATLAAITPAAWAGSTTPVTTTPTTATNGRTPTLSAAIPTNTSGPPANALWSSTVDVDHRVQNNTAGQTFLRLFFADIGETNAHGLHPNSVVKVFTNPIQTPAAGTTYAVTFTGLVGPTPVNVSFYNPVGTMAIYNGAKIGSCTLAAGPTGQASFVTPRTCTLTVPNTAGRLEVNIQADNYVGFSNAMVSAVKP